MLRVIGVIKEHTLDAWLRIIDIHRIQSFLYIFFCSRWCTIQDMCKRPFIHFDVGYSLIYIDKIIPSLLLQILHFYCSVCIFWVHIKYIYFQKFIWSLFFLRGLYLRWSMFIHRLHNDFFSRKVILRKRNLIRKCILLNQFPIMTSFNLFFCYLCHNFISHWFLWNH